MITSTILTIVLLAPGGQHVESLPLTFATRAECRAEKAMSHASTLPAVSTWRIVRADCKPARGAK